uniref:Uncharacterized protein n=1 Tax=Trichogramma kaykai TaxID=54128 RepID=A0ABD2W5W7_9HYME
MLVLTRPSSRQISVIVIGYIKLRSIDWLHLDEIHSYSSSRPLYIYIYIYMGQIQNFSNKPVGEVHGFS